MSLGVVATGLLVVASVVLLRRELRSRWASVAVAGLAFLSLLLAGAYLVADRLTGSGIDDSVIFHLGAGLRGATTSGYRGLMAEAGIFVLAALAFSLWAWASMRAPGGAQTNWVRVGAGLLLLSESLLVNPAVHDGLRLARPLLQAARVTAGPAPDEFRHVRGLAFAGRPKNLVYVFLESVERTYLDETLFPGLMPNLAALEKEALSFTNVTQPALAKWTVAGMVASLCGVPLFGAAGNSMSKADDFMPGVDCLTDLLGASGYELDYLGGAALEFAGKGLFLRSHGFDYVAGREELAPGLPEGEALSYWGLYDDELDRLAAERFDARAAAGQPFGLFLLTLDTHHPDGYPSPSCTGMPYGDGSNPILNAVHCADRMAATLIEHIRQSPAFADTVLVVASDHLAMPNTAWGQLEAGERRNLLMFFADGLPPRADDRIASPLDVAPTLGTLLGADVRALGFGRSLLAEAPTLAETRAPLDTFLSAQHPFLTSLWTFPEISDGITLDVRNGTLRLGDRSVGYPALIVLDTDLGVSEIQFDVFDQDDPLSQRIEELDYDQPFIWVDRCGATAFLAAGLGAAADDPCVVYGALGAPEFDGRAVGDGDRIAFRTLERYFDGMTPDRNLGISRRRDWRRDRQIGTDEVIADAPRDTLTGHFLFRSAGFGAGPSYVTDVESESRIELARGINVIGLNPRAPPLWLAQFDTCAWEGVIHDVDNLFDSVGGTLAGFTPYFGGFAVMVHDSATCDEPTDLPRLFAGTPLTRWAEVGYRTPYVALLHGDGTVREHVGPAETYLTIEARDFLRRQPLPAQRRVFDLPRIAHAGGIVDGMIETDSLDALEANAALYDLFEIDFSWTSDGQLVCLHHWGALTGQPAELESQEPGALLTEAEFESLVQEQGGFRRCTLDSLVDWLRENPGKRIVTDVKSANPEALKLIAARYPDLVDRFVPQVYQPQEYPLARSLGFDDVLWTLYRYDGDDQDVLAWIRFMDLYGLVMPVAEVGRGLARRAQEETGVLSWVHTINSNAAADAMKRLGVTEIMTDRLPPSDGD